LENGYQVKISKLGGYYWTETAPIFRSYIDELFQKKQTSMKGSPTYLLGKLFMNGLYGKFIQRPIDEKSRWIKTNAQFWKFFS
jgi:hypothetical protein